MSKPLAHKTIVLTRRPEQSVSMTAALESLGAEVLSFPTITFIPPPDERIVRQAIAELDTYKWILFTSANAVDFFFDYLPAGDRQIKLPKAAVVGPATGEALEAHGVHPALMAENFQAEGVVEVFSTLPHSEQTITGHEGKGKNKSEGKGKNKSEGKVLIPRALEARDVLEKQLPKLGYEVVVAPVYQTVQPDVSPKQLADIEQADAAVFSSPSAVRHFVDILDRDRDVDCARGGQAIDYLRARKIFSIGPVTTAELRRYQLDRGQIFEAGESTAKSLVDLIAKSF